MRRLWFVRLGWGGRVDVMGNTLLGFESVKDHAWVSRFHYSLGPASIEHRLMAMSYAARSVF